MKKALICLGIILSCIAAQAQRPAAAGIEFEYTTFNYDTIEQGSFRKTVVVKSNAANAPTSVLRIKGFVREKKVQRIKKRRN